MISHAHKFILITPEKTGSVSLVSALLNYIDTNKLIQGENEITTSQALSQECQCFDFSDNFQVHSKHSSIHHYYAKWVDSLGSIESYIKCGVVRNPYDRMISWWRWEEERFHEGRALKDFLMQWPQWRETDLLGRFTYNNELMVTEFIRFETLQEDFNIICDKIGIPQRDLPHKNKNKTKTKHYTEYYDEVVKDLIRYKYKQDLKMYE